MQGAVKVVRWPGVTEFPPREGIIHSQQILLDFVEYLWSHVSAMTKSNRVVARLKEQYEADMRALGGIFQEQAGLRVAHLRYRDLEQQAKERIERIRRLAVILWPHEIVGIKRTVTSRAQEMGIALPEGWEGVAAWEVVLEIVRQFPNVRMVDLLQWLEYDLGIKASRQSVDSALNAHRDLFRVKRAGKGKYISLAEKEAT